ncbi:uncharacterized protein PHA67_020784 isoform 2-T4 [Liasis olivaceus]
MPHLNPRRSGASERPRVKLAFILKRGLNGNVQRLVGLCPGKGPSARGFPCSGPTTTARSSDAEPSARFQRKAPRLSRSPRSSRARLASPRLASPAGAPPANAARRRRRSPLLWERSRPRGEEEEEGAWGRARSRERNPWKQG